MKRLIFNIFAYKEKYGVSGQLHYTSTNKKVSEIYYKNTYVSLWSIKANNPDVDVALFTNIDTPEKWTDLYQQVGIEIIKVPFEKYTFPQNFSWALTAYKLNALEWAVENLEYDEYVFLDSDTITLDSLTPIWNELEHNTNSIMLYNVGHMYGHPHRQVILENYKMLYGKDEGIVHYGGEFIAGSKKMLVQYMREVSDVFRRIEACEFNVHPDTQDETLISIGARNIKILDAIPYMCRYWTDKTFYLVSTNWSNNPVLIWHLPAEKTRGILRVYNYVRRHNKLPAKEKMRNYMSLPVSKPPIKWYTYWWRLKLKLLKNI